METSTILTLLSVSWLVWAAISAWCFPKRDPGDHTYTGEFSESGNYHGKGRVVTKMGDIFEGNFEDGVIDGYGEWFRGSSQSRFAGLFKKGDLVAGREMRSDGSWYEGSFHGGRKALLGAHSAAAPELGMYVGGFKDGLRHGPSCVFYRTGDIFEGKYREGLRDGIGVLMSASGVRRTGVWKKGKLAEWLD